MTTSYGYDKDSRLTGIATRNNRGEILDSYTYTHDKVGNRLSKTDPDAKSTYSYDAVYKLLQSMLTKLHGKDKEQEHKAENYAYDPVGNRMTGPKPKGAAFYNQGNQLVNDRKHQYEYDKNGNLIRKAETDDDGITKVWTYSYDYENRLIKVEIQKGGKVKAATFTYDPFGRRLSKAVHREEVEDPDDDRDEEEKECPRTTYYVYDNEEIILEYNHKGKVTARYIHGPGIDEPLAVEREHGRYYYHADGLGSITALTDSKGKVAQRYDYDSFGNLKHNGNKVKQPHAYTGREYDKETGLYYYRARYYDPKAGRFIQKDPIGFAGGDVNLYGYVGNNPVNWVDPLGLDATNWLYPHDGRPTGYGPTNGNWGGKCWSGGQYSCGEGRSVGNAPPTDSGDECYQRHDYCYDRCGNNSNCLATCNRQLMNELRRLPENSREWLHPPRPGTEEDSEWYRRGAIIIFGR